MVTGHSTVEGRIVIIIINIIILKLLGNLMTHAKSTHKLWLVLV